LEKSQFWPKRNEEMVTLGIFVRLEAKSGKEEELAAFLRQGLELAQRETTTPVWFALRLGGGSFAIFDAFADETGRQAHLNGAIAKALMAQAPNLLAEPPVIQQLEVVGAKLT
jgi:quinol monooxygenase YgiN